jgi:dihydrolipoamide dehydrogenase
MKKNLLLVALVLCAVGAFFYFDIHSYLSLSYIKSQQSYFSDLYNANPILYICVFSLIYILTTAVSFPGATVLTLLAGALFGVVLGSVIVSFASTIGATVAFLMTRFFLRDSVTRRFGKYLKSFNKGMEKDGVFYLFTIRLTPVVPFFVVNTVMGLTKMPTWIFYVVSQIGMIPGTIIYVNAGTQLANLESLKDVLSFPVFLSLLALGVFPVLIKFVVTYVRKRKLYSRFQKPKTFDYNLVVIGGGSAGLVTAYIAAAAKAKVALIEKHKMGGDCLNTGCIPSKTFIRSAKFIADAHRSQELGIEQINVKFQFADVMERVQRVIKAIEPHDSIERYSSLGVECLTGEGQIIDPWTIEVNGKKLTTKNMAIATGARPSMPPIPGLKDMAPLTSDTLWDLRELPQKLLVLGAGPIGMELAQSFAHFGSQVTVLEMADRLFSKEDKEVSEWMAKKFKKDGLEILTSTKTQSFSLKNNLKTCTYTSKDGASQEMHFDQVLVATGRQPNTKGFGLEKIGVELNEKGAIRVNEKLQTNFPNIYACGDVTGMYQFTHMASYQAWYASMNSLLSPFYSFKARYEVIPWCTYTDPEIARVGMSETDAIAAEIDHKVTFFNTDHLDRALTEESAYGFVKIITAGSSDKILGVTIVGLHAGECLTEFVLAMKHGLGLNKILQTIHVYPTLTEANKFAAGQWRRSGLSEGTLKVSELFNKWQRR